MHNHYIINGIIEFHPATSTLRDLEDPENVVVLNSPAGRCLLLLINRIGTIVTQQELMDIVWAKSGMQVSPNTYYQNISILRKGLKKFNLKEDPVVTIPRIGLTLASSTRIHKMTAEQQREDAYNETQSMSNAGLTSEPGERQSPEGESEGDGVEGRLPAEVRVRVASRQLYARRLALCGAGVLVGVAFLSGIVLGTRPHNEVPFFAHYRFLTTMDGCHIFVTDKSSTAAASREVESLGEQMKARCHSYPWVYVTHSSMLPRVSVIRCNKPINEVSTCISDYFIKGGQDA